MPPSSRPAATPATKATQATVHMSHANGSTIRHLLQQFGLARSMDLLGQLDATRAAAAATEERYVVTGLIGPGGMGTVHEACDTYTHRTVALKVLRKDRALSPEQVVRFIEEVQVTAQLEHPNIVPVHELGVDREGRVFYTMKRVRGDSLQELLTRWQHFGPPAEWPLARRLTIFLRACDALAFAHSRGVIHRDLKPANIMVGEYGEVLVLDWGLAKVLVPGHPAPEAPRGPPAAAPPVVSVRQERPLADNLTEDGIVMGTPTYMSPEQARGDAGTIGPASDIYALGAVLYALLTLRSPFDDEPDDLERVLAQVQAGAFRRPRTVTPTVPAALEAVVLKAMARKPADRYPTVPELQHDVEAWLHGYATQAEQAGWGRQLWLLAGRHLGLVASLVGISLALSMGLVIALAQRQAAMTARDGESLARHQAERARRLAEERLLRITEEQQARLALSRLAAPEYLARARRELALQQWAAAKRSLDMATALDPQLGEAWYLVGHWYFRQLRGAEAAAAYTRSHDLLPVELASRAAQLAALAQAQDEPGTPPPRPALAAACRSLGEPRLADWLEDAHPAGDARD